MGWFDEQIHQRIQGNKAAFSHAFEDLAEMLTGNPSAHQSQDGASHLPATLELLHYFNRKPKKHFSTVENLTADLFQQMEQEGILWRDVTLSEKWYQDGIYPLLVHNTDNQLVALIPQKTGGYRYTDGNTRTYIKVTEKNKNQFSTQATSFYRPFPQRALDKKDLFVFMKKSLSISDARMLVLSSILIVLTGLIPALVNYILFEEVVHSGNNMLLLSATALLVGVAIATTIFSVIKKMVICGIEEKLNIAIKSATMMRLLSLPTDFFKKYSSGALAERMQNIEILCLVLTQGFLTLFTSVVFSLLYLGQIWSFVPELLLPTILVMFALALHGFCTIYVQGKIFFSYAQEHAIERGLIFSLLSGIQKIKQMGAEHRAFAKWAEQYKESAKYLYKPPMYLQIHSGITIAITTIGTLLLYHNAMSADLVVADYIAFTIAYGVLLTAFQEFTELSPIIGQMQPALLQFMPILEATPEQSEQKKPVARLSGGIELSHIHFRYADDMPWILNNLSLKVSSGEYLGIVGTSGSGKSTLLRLLLGFETPQKGSIYWDGKDSTRIDMKSIRKRTGVVLQDGALFGGSIYSNLTVATPNSSEEDIWNVLEQAGIADDIKKMPMKLQTILPEGGGGISGGQRQRLLIARALISNPKIMIMDEATSALDNISQQQVTTTLNQLKCTRIVVAHRLSTIKQCHRIVVLDKGQIAESGSYQELLDQKGLFYQLAKGQLM